jgi:hypothetical protein
MNWLFVGLPLAGFYIVWFGYLIYKRNYTRQLLLFALAHLPYLFLNVVAPFRGIFDSEYAGYNIGLLSVPQGILVPLVVGTIVVLSFIITTKSLKGKMEKWWTVALIFDLSLLITIAFPVLVDILSNISEFRLELGEYLQVSGWFVALIIFVLLPGPTLYATWVSMKNTKILSGKN